jgi:hypothetical protein
VSDCVHVCVVVYVCMHSYIQSFIFILTCVCVGEIPWLPNEVAELIGLIGLDAGTSVCVCVCVCVSRV